MSNPFLDNKNKLDHLNISNELMVKKIDETFNLILTAKNILKKY